MDLVDSLSLFLSPWLSPCVSSLCIGIFVCAFLEFLQVHHLCLVFGFSILEETFSLQIKSPLKKMVIVKGDHEAEEVGSVVGDLSTVVLSSPLLFEDFLLNLTEKAMTSSTDTRTVGSVLGLWHWLPSRFVGNTAPKGSNGLPSFFLSLGLSTKAHPRSEKQGGPLLQSWLAGQAPLWAQELSSQWQVTLPPNPCCASCNCTCVMLIALLQFAHV